MERSITGRDGYIFDKASALAEALADSAFDCQVYNDWFETETFEERAARVLACAIAAIQWLPDEQQPWSDCQDMIAILCNLVPEHEEREKIAVMVHQLVGKRPKFHDENAGELVSFPTPE